jgi:hypothetical protein
MFSSSVLLKIGVSSDVKRRLSEINGGFPPAAVGRWSLQLVSEAFIDRATAEAAEQIFKDKAAPGLRSLGDEFFQGEWTSAVSAFAEVPGVSRFGNAR